MGAWAEIEKVQAMIERTRAKSAGLVTRRPRIDNQALAEMRLREERILRRRAAEATEFQPNRPPRPLMHNPVLAVEVAP